MAEVNMEMQEMPVGVAFKVNYQPPVFDLSGAVPFEIYLTTRINNEEGIDARPTVLLKDGSVFDLPAALSKGLIELVDEETGEIVRPNDSAGKPESDQVAPIALTADAFTTLPLGNPRKHRAEQDVPLHAALHLRAFVQPDHKYHLRLHDRSLGVRWWKWGGLPDLSQQEDELPPSEAKNLVSSRPLPVRSKTFTVVLEIPLPPKPAIHLSLAEQGLAPAGVNEASNEPESSSSPAVQITIVNPSSRPLILKTIGDQPYLRPPGAIPNPCPLVTNEKPGLDNFCIVDQETQGDLISHAPVFTQPLKGGSGQGWPRNQFLELAPQDKVVRTVKLPGHRMTSGRGYKISLRSEECWWKEGTLDELFGKGERLLKMWPREVTVGMVLDSEDELLLER